MFTTTDFGTCWSPDAIQAARKAKRLSQRLVGIFFALALATPLPLLGCGRSPSHNLVLITLDTVRRDRLGAYGYDRLTSPNLDALAKRGALFDDAIAQATTTPPSHASILTGLNPTTHGLRRLYGQRLPSTNRTLAELLRDAGYTTAAFVSAVPLRSDIALDQGFDVYDDRWPDVDGEPQHDRRAGETNERVFAWLDTGPREPVFLWVHYFDPHYPYAPPDEYRTRFGVLSPPARLPVPVNKNPTTGGGTPYPAPSRKLLQKIVKLYDGEIAYMDAAIGELLSRLEQSGILENAIVAVVADHGEHLGEDGYFFGHWDVREETAKVPMLLVRPDGRFAGTKVDATVGTIDLMPTLVRWLGLSAQLEFDGRDLTPVLEGEDLPPRMVYTEQFEYFPTRAVRDGEWLLQQRARKRMPLDSGELELYRRVRGTNALERVIDRPDVEERLGIGMYGFASPANRHATDKITVSTEVRDQLRALGYTGE